MTRKGQIHVTILFVTIMALVWLALVSYLTILMPLSNNTLFFPLGDPAFIYPLDFLHFYQVGKLAAGSMHEHVYDPQVQFAVFNQIISPHVLPHVLYTPYTPFAFVLMRPFAALSLEQAYLVWMFLAIITVCGGIYLLLRRLRHLPMLDTIMLMVLLVASMPAFSSIRTGQLTWFLLGLLCLFVWSWKKEHMAVAGLCLALMTIKPQYVIFLIAALVAQRQWKILGYASVAELILIGIASWTIGFSNVINYPLFLYQAEHSRMFIGFGIEAMVNLRKFLSLFLPLDLSLQLSVVGLAIALVWTYLLWTDSGIFAQKEKFRWAISLTVVIAIFFSPHTYYYDCFLLAVPVCLTLPPPSTVAFAGKLDIAGTAWIWLLSLYPLTSWITCLSMPSKSLQALPLLFINLVLLIACAVHHYKKRANQPS